MEKLNKYDIEFLVECLKSGKEIPEDYKYAIFPTKQKEYELVYAGKMRKEDVLADTEEAKPVPLQIEKFFSNAKDSRDSKDWHNLLIFGDNLQILKTFNENKDPLVKNKIKSKVRLIYIDPPFATADEFQNTNGAKAYSDKVKGAEFIEFLRRRLIVAKEILADDGSIYVHCDWRMSGYMRVVLDEIFGKDNFLNEIIWQGTTGDTSDKNKKFIKSHDTIFIYEKNKNNHIWNDVFQKMSEGGLKPYKYEDENGRFRWRDCSNPGGSGYIYDLGCGEKVPTNGYRMPKATALQWIEEGKLKVEKDRVPCVKQYLNVNGVRCKDVWGDLKSLQGNEFINYPTQKPEALLERIIRASSNEGDIILDFFCGSGTTLAVAEKLNRRWVGCDIGKLAMYTTQKRLLRINQGKDLEDPKKKYRKSPRSFTVVASGLYDLGKVFALKKDEYIKFVKDLFEIEETKIVEIGGVETDGKKRGFYTKIFPYWDFENTSVDENYLQEMHKSVGKKIGDRFYIIAPANNVDFISDYYQIDNVRYYFLKVPYQIINELHKVQFKKLRQPQSEGQINDLDEAIGFHFIRPPEVKSEVKILKDKVVLKIKKFESAYQQDELGKKIKNFESLAMLLLDLKYDGEKFIMTDYSFAENLINNIKSKKEGGKEEIKKEFLKEECGKQIMAVYVDIYGNEFREKFDIG